MKRLLLVRHAKSSWADPRQRDIDRPLNERGKRAAPEMARRLLARKQLPELIVSSAARRALATAQLFAHEFGIDKAGIEIVDALYEANTEIWLKTIRGLPGKAGTVLMVGHNPELTALAQLLCPQAHIDNVPTCGVLRLDYAVRAWSAVAGSTPAEWAFDYPKNAASNN